jgi:hypothetical protein
MAPKARDVYVGWVNTDTRSTSDILFGCLSTLVICVYTALHMNISLSNRSKASKWAHHASWILIGTFAPEAILTAAVAQHVAARSYQREIDRRCNAGIFPDGARGRSWRRIFSHFVLMGGYQLVHATAVQRLALRIEPDCVIQLLNNPHFKPVDLKEIQARSRASTLAKTLSATQASWLAVQFVGRLGQGLPVTELEVNTIAHIFFALVTWGFWLHKPYDVDGPQELELDSELGAFVAGCWVLEHGGAPWMFARLLRKHIEQSQTMNKISASTCWEPPLQAALERMRDTAADVVVLEGCSHADTQTLEHYRHQRTDAKFVLLLSSCGDARKSMRNFDEVYGQDLPPVLIIALRRPGTEDRPRCWLGEDENVEYIEVNELGYLLQRRFWTAPDLSGLLSSLDQAAVDNAHRHRSFLRSIPSLREVPVCGPPPLMLEDPIMRQDAWSKSTSWSLRWVVGVAMTVVYGAIHAALWNAHFPSIAEMWLWRVSSIVVGSAAPLLLVVVAFASSLPKHWDNIGIVILCSLAVILCAARAFLVIEAFISLRSQPVEVYQQVNWTQYIPHI